MAVHSPPGDGPGSDAAGNGPPQTCGAGLAAHADVPAAMAELIATLAANLDAHIPTIDDAGEAGRLERDAYADLGRAYRAIAIELRAAAERMRGYRDLPAAPHHDEALADPALLDAFADLVAAEERLAGLVRESADRDRAMLEAFRTESG